MSKPTDYILASAAETDRLRLQARVWEPVTEAMLDLMGGIIVPSRLCFIDSSLGLGRRDEVPLPDAA
ncbi:MAG: hypothetical protein ACRDGG_06150 [Anaerolineae bacterium]